MGLIVSHIISWTPGMKLSQQPSPLGRGCPAAGAFASWSGTGEGLLAPRGEIGSPRLKIFLDKCF